jgi:hypothetical protein
MTTVEEVLAATQEDVEVVAEPAAPVAQTAAAGAV